MGQDPFQLTHDVVRAAVYDRENLARPAVLVPGLFTLVLAAPSSLATSVVTHPAFRPGTGPAPVGRDGAARGRLRRRAAGLTRLWLRRRFCQPRASPVGRSVSRRHGARTPALGAMPFALSYSVRASLLEPVSCGRTGKEVYATRRRHEPLILVSCGPE